MNFRASKRNGVYVLTIRNGYEGYVVKSSCDQAAVRKVTINGRYISTMDTFETECDDFEIEDGVLNLRYNE